MRYFVLIKGAGAFENRQLGIGDEHSKGSATDDVARGLEPAMLTSSCA